MRPRLTDYAEAYRHVRFERSATGVLTMSLHSEGDSMVWGAAPHEELGFAFQDAGADRENKVILLTGAGSAFCARLDSSWVGEMTPAKWDVIHANGRRLLASLLDIEVPVIGVLNGPAHIHAELALLSDIVVAADTATIQDAPHFRFDTVPSDGVHAVWPALLGPNRGRHFLLTGRRITPEEALEYGLVAEVVPAAEVIARGRELAEQLASHDPLILRHTRAALTQQLKRLLLDNLHHGLALEGLGAYATWPSA